MTGDLDVARALIRAGVPVFAAPPATDSAGNWDPAGGTGGCGYWLPKGWERTVPTENWLDPAAVGWERKAWRPGYALGAVMGHRVDLLDVDPRNGGDATRAGMVEAGMWPTVYGSADTPSGGTHEFIATLGVTSLDALRPGLDVKAGDQSGRGRGFAFIAPTRKVSKTTGEISAYRWTTAPDLDALAEGDDSGAAIAALIEHSRKPTTSGQHDDQGEDWPHTGPIAAGKRYPSLRSYAGSLRRRGLRHDEALALFKLRWQDCAQPAGDPYPWETAESLLADIYGRYASGTAPDEAPGAAPDEAPGAAPDEAPDGQASGRRALNLTKASTIRLRPVHWLWEGRVPLGSLGLLAGREGIGKSTIGYWMTAQITRGALPGKYLGTPKAVIVCATEDSWSHTIAPRLIAHGADLDRVYRIDPVTSEGVDTTMSLPRDLAGLRNAVADVDAALILLDPLISRLGANLDVHKDSEVRLALEPVAAIADATNAAVLGVIHVNKTATSDVLTSVMASRAFVAVSRSVQFVVKDPDDETQRMLGTAKNNLGRTDLPTLTFTIEGVKVADTDEGPVWTGKVRWTGETERTVSDAVADGATGETKTATGEAADWLTDYLLIKGGSEDSAACKRAGHGAGHAEATLKRAAKKIGVVATVSGYPRRSQWALPPSLLGEPVGSPPASPVGSPPTVGSTPPPSVSSLSGINHGESDLNELNDPNELNGLSVGSLSSLGS